MLKRKMINTLVVLTIIATAISCKKELPKPESRPSFSDLKDTVVHSISLTPAQAVALYEDDADLKINCALYQLADALRANLNATLLESIYTDMMGTSEKVLYYDDLFAGNTQLADDIDTYLSSHTYDQPYEFNSYSEIKEALEKDDITYDASIYIPEGILTALGATPSFTDYILAIPVEVDDADLNSQDEIFAWEVTDNVPITVAVGETGALNAGKGVFITGIAKKTSAYDPEPDENSPYSSGSNLWGSESHEAKMNRFKIYTRHEANGKSEVEISKADYTWLGAVSNDDFGHRLKEVSKNDVNTDIYITPYKLTDFISWNEDKYVMYNLYEYDWYGNVWYLGGAQSGSGWGSTIKGRRKFVNDYYIFNPSVNTPSSGNPLDKIHCNIIYTNGYIVINGDMGNASFIY